MDEDREVSLRYICLADVGDKADSRGEVKLYIPSSSRTRHSPTYPPSTQVPKKMAERSFHRTRGTPEPPLLHRAAVRLSALPPQSR